MTRIVQAAIPGSSLSNVFTVLASLPTWLSPSNKRYKTQFDKDSSKFEALISKIQLDTVCLLTLHAMATKSFVQSEQVLMGANLLGMQSTHAELTVKETACHLAYGCPLVRCFDTFFISRLMTLLALVV